MQDELANLFDQQLSMRSLPPQPEPQPITYISQHYHHSTHVVSAPTYELAPPSPVDDSMPGIMEILWQHGVDPGSLTPSQLDLFKHADIEQKQRLVQTWQLYSRSSGEMAQDQANSAAQPEDLEMDLSREDAEPYMQTGYETNNLPTEPTTGRPYNPAKDPVYNSRQWWERVQMGPMESQYGAFEEMNRCY